MSNPALPAASVRRVNITSRRKRVSWTSVGPVALGTLGILLFLAIWQVVSVSGMVNATHMPPPTVVLERFVMNFVYAEFWAAVGNTMKAWLLGVSISTVLGIIAGIIIGSSRILTKATHSTVEFFRPIPAVALIPIAALLFGPRIGTELMIIIYACFWVVLIQVFYGISDVDKVAVDTARTLRMNFAQRVRYLLFPTLLPFLMTGLRLSATIALILAISVELIVGTPGLGQEVAFAQINGSAPAIYALIITSGLLGIAINMIMRFVERKTLFWHQSVRGGTSL